MRALHPINIALDPNDGPLARAASRLLLAAVITVVFLDLVYWNAVLQDDAFISFVYARNLIRGEGLVYNVGEPPVEGYTNFLWTCLAAGGMKLGLAPENAVRMLGLIVSVCAVLLTARLARRLGVAPLLASAAALLLATRRAVVFESMGGLETVFFSVLTSAGVLLRLPADRSRRADLVSSGLLGAAALTRPEGVLVFGLLELWELAAAARNRALAGWFRGGLPRWLPFLIIVVPHLIWRYATYGDIVPNTFHAKVSGGAAQFRAGLNYVGQSLLYFGPVVFLLPYAVLGARRKERGFTLCLYLVSVYALYVAVVGGDYKPTSRFLIPIMPLACALGAAALQSIATRVGSLGRVPGPVWATLLLFVLGGASARYEFGSNEALPHRQLRNRQLRAAGRFLDAELPEGAWIAVCNAGTIPYYADRRTIDMLGLNDRHIAQRAVQPSSSGKIGHLKGDGRYVLDQKPAAILFMKVDVGGSLSAEPEPLAVLGERLFGTSEREIYVDPRFRRRYRLRSDFLGESVGYLNWFERVPAGRPRR